MLGFDGQDVRHCIICSDQEAQSLERMSAVTELNEEMCFSPFLTFHILVARSEYAGKRMKMKAPANQQTHANETISSCSNLLTSRPTGSNGLILVSWTKIELHIIRRYRSILACYGRRMARRLLYT